jgi:hypothetical protein
MTVKTLRLNLGNLIVGIYIERYYEQKWIIKCGLN